MFKKLFSNTVFINFSYLSLGTAFSQIISLLTLLKITTFLNPSDYGLFTFFIAQGALLLKIGDLGNSSITIRTIARTPSATNDLLFNGVILRLFALVLLSLIYILYNHYWGSLTQEELILVFAYTAISCIAKTLELVFLGNQKMLPISLISLLNSIAWYGCIHYLTTTTENVSITYLFTIYVFLILIKVIIYLLWLFASKLLIGQIKELVASTKDMCKESWPYFIMLIIMLPLTSFSNNFLDINSTSEEIGFFNLSQRLIGPISLLIAMFLNAVFPNFSSLWVKDKSRFYHYISAGFRFYILLTVVSCFLFTLFTKEIVQLLFPKEYISAVRVCQMQVWYLFLTSVDSLIGTILGATNNEKLIMKFGFIYLLVCTPALIYGSKFGALGLAYGYIISYGFCLIFVWQIFKKVLNIKIIDGGAAWFVSIILFVVSTFISTDTDITYKLILAFSTVSSFLYYIYRSYKPILVA